MQINVNSLTCFRCAHVWIPRQPEVRICPHCKTAYWDKPRAPVSGETQYFYPGLGQGYPVMLSGMIMSGAMVQGGGI